MISKINKWLDKLAEWLGISPEQEMIPVPIKKPKSKRKRK
jgi:hypothetical protein